MKLTYRTEKPARSQQYHSSDRDVERQLQPHYFFDENLSDLLSVSLEIISQTTHEQG